MKIDLKVTGVDQARAVLGAFSERRLNAAVATGLTRTARLLDQSWREELGSRLDRPTPGTTRATVVRQATARSLRAEVFIRDQSGQAGALTPAQWLSPQEAGGGRYVKKFERALQAQGSMPPNTKVVPGRYASIDGYGNISRGQIVQVLAQLGTDFSPGYQRVISKSLGKRLAKAKASGRTYVAVTQRKGKLKPGVYIRGGAGMRELLPVFYYVSNVQYRKRLDLVGAGQRVAATRLTAEIDRAINESAQRKAAQMVGGGA